MCLSNSFIIHCVKAIIIYQSQKYDGITTIIVANLTADYQMLINLFNKSLRNNISFAQMQ